LAEELDLDVHVLEEELDLDVLKKAVKNQKNN
jgi:hypothetical protein